MPAFLLALLGGLVQIAGSMVGSVLIALGISAVTYTGVSSLFDQIKVIAFSNMDLAASYAGLSGWLGLLKVGTCMNILFSALAARLALKGLQGGAVKRWVTK